MPIGVAGQEEAGKYTFTVPYPLACHQNVPVRTEDWLPPNCVTSINLVPALHSFQHLNQSTKKNPRTTKTLRLLPESQEDFARIVVFLGTWSGESNQRATGVIFNLLRLRKGL